MSYGHYYNTVLNEGNDLKLKLITWNVNGIRAVSNKGFLEWLQKEKPHYLCLQEIKAHEEQLDEELLRPKSYRSHLFSAEKKGYSGVATYLGRGQHDAQVTNGLGVEEFDREGRSQIIETEHFILFNGYYPNGQRDHGRVPYKLNFSQAMLDHALKLHKETGKEIILTGDFNTAHHPIDLKNPKTNKDTTGFLPNERAFLDHMIDQGFVDVFRHFHPEEEGHYSWWSYRSQCRERNIGWRIDYFFMTKGLLSKVKKVKHLPEVLGSDHCPIYLELDL